MLDCDPEIVSNVMNVSTAKCWSNDVNIPHPIVAMKKNIKNNNNSPQPSTRNYQGGFSTSLILKDLSLALNVMKESSGSDTKNSLPMTSLSKDLYQQLIQENKGWDQKDFGVMFQYLLEKQKGKK